MRATRVYVQRKRDESFESLLARFKKGVADDNLILTMKHKMYFESPSVGRQRKRHRKLLKSRQNSGKDGR